MITTVTGKITKIGQGRYTTGSNTPVIDFNMSVDRGNTTKRKSMLNGKEYSVDFYKITLFGKSALSFAQFAQVGRMVEVAGRLLQEEYVATNQTVQITPDNALFQYFAQLVGKLPQEVIATDNQSIYIKGNFPVTRTNMTCMEYRFRDENPNSGTEGFGSFQPNQGGFNAQGFGGTQAGFSGGTQAGFGAQTQGFGTQPTANTGFGANQGQVAGFGAQQNNQGFGFGNTQPPVANQGFGQAPVCFSAQSNPETQSNFAGFGAPSAQPTGFGAQTQAGFGAIQAPVDQAVNTGFAPNANATGFAPESNPTGATTGSVETNIPAPETAVNAEKTEEKQVSNQGF